MDTERTDEHTEHHELMITHVVLPRKLPQARSSCLHEQELGLLKLMSCTVRGLEEWIPPNTLSMMDSLERVHVIQSPQIVTTEINALQPGNTFAMFVRRQNCALMIHLPSTQNYLMNAIVSTFPGNLHPDEVYKHSGDLEFTFPVQALHVKFSQLIKSNAFAEQLSFLYGQSAFDMKKRNYVSNWLVTTLCDDSSRPATTKEFPFVRKKMRDEVLGKNKATCFRRSSFYMCMKVFLQHSLTLELGESKGKIYYKLVMLDFMADLCDSLTGIRDIDLMSQLIAKIARRMEKLEQAELLSDDTFEQLKEHAFYHARDAISKIRSKINSQIEKLQLLDESNAQLSPLIDLDFAVDVVQKTPKLHEYLKKRSHGNVLTPFSLRLHVKSYRRYSRDLVRSPRLENFDSFDTLNVFDKCLFLADYENWILYTLDINGDQFSSKDIREWSFKYGPHAESFHKNDPLGTSKMVLVRMKIITMLDKLATKACPLLLEHRSGVNTDILKNLLLPQHVDMEIAFEIESYFANRNAQSQFPSLVEEHSVTAESFSARFAARNPSMQDVRKELNTIDQENIAVKQKEWIALRREISSLRWQAGRVSHDIISKKHIETCYLCSIEKRIAEIKVTEYLKIMPDEEYKQNAIVFELDIPTDVACLRDVLEDFNRYCSQRKASSYQIQMNWNERDVISKFNRSTSGHVRLGLTYKAVQLTNYHAGENFERFVLSNTDNCVYHWSKQQLTTMTTNYVKTECTLSTDTRYRCLQDFLSGTNHTQNQVLALQWKCPPDMLLSEFKCFGSLRADGHRLQLRKLYAMIEYEELSFNQPSVLSLVAQSLWEAGKSGDSEAVRESFIDFRNVSFTHAFIETINKFIDQQSNNWMHSLKLLSIVLVVVRMFEINNDTETANSIMAVIHKIRSLVLNWIDDIEMTIHKMGKSTKSGDLQNIQQQLFNIAIVGAMTFFVHSNHKYFDKIFDQNPENKLPGVVIWLRFIVVLNNNIILGKSNSAELNSVWLWLRRLLWKIGVEIESKVRLSIEQNPSIVLDVVKHFWKRAQSGVFAETYFDDRSPQIVVVNVDVGGKLVFVTLDIISGSLLVDNLPVTRLSQDIVASKLFQRIFGHSVFEVQPDAQNRFSTVHSYNDCFYEFFNEPAGLIITEKRNEVVKELIPSTILQHEIPDLLVRKFSHWWNKNDKTIEFRPILFTNLMFSKAEGVEYRLDLKECRLIEMKSKRCFLDITSNSYKQIVTNLSRLEIPKFIHILMDEPQVARAELFRMRLNFIVKKTPADVLLPKRTHDHITIRRATYDILSNEFSDMRVSLRQKCGTLYGLMHGLLLEGVPNANVFPTKLLLIPHGSVAVQRHRSHVIVQVNVKDGLHTPPFHEYYIDELLHWIKPNNSNFAAWLYLAYLHAVTSHGEIEHLTGMSGTERALQILQSGVVWSSSPYDSDAASILQRIAELSPTRTLGTIRSVEWPQIVPARSAQDTFVFIARKLIADSERLGKLFSNATAKSISTTSSATLQLNQREYSRYVPFAPNVCVADEFTTRCITTTSYPSFIDETLSWNTMKLSFLYHRKEFQSPSGLKKPLYDYFLSVPTLDGATHIKEVEAILQHSFHRSNLKNLWLSLYEAIRTSSLNLEESTLVWTLLSHQNHDIALILILQTISMSPGDFASIIPPAAPSFQLHQGEYTDATIQGILRQRITHQHYWTSEHEKVKKEMILRAGEVRSKWPCDSMSFLSFSDCLDLTNALPGINQKLRIWNNNRKLRLFFEAIDAKLLELSVRSRNYMAKPYWQQYRVSKQLKWKKYDVDIDARIHSSIGEFDQSLAEALKVWTSANENESNSSDYWWTLYKKIIHTSNVQHLVDSGLCPRIVPSIILPRIAADETDPRLKALLGALAIAIAKEQREKRIDRYSNADPMKERELENIPHVNWRPSDYPNWLLFEIEQNLTIRRIQIEIAKRMINPPDVGAQHSVMQLNMGEGKTAIIVPILASYLADGKQACQVTVLRSLFATNAKSLRNYLGGMIGRRIYLFPCRRDLPVRQHVETIMQLYEECKVTKGVIVTLPEYRLSFQLMMYSSVQKREFDVTKRFLAAHNWINANVRNILDESDAILHPKYQLIYTVGQQLPPDGNDLRWLVVQSLLKRVPFHMERLQAELGDEAIEFDREYLKKYNIFGGTVVNNRPDVFTSCRILDENLVFPKLMSALSEDFLNGQLDIVFQEPITAMKECLKIALYQDPDKMDAKYLEILLAPFSERERKIVLILCGYLRLEVLKLTLTKRWRVNYGVDPNGERLMAIPFKAKDVAANRTEFGHPDVAICFTHLSYYYSGLTNAQMIRIFEILSQTANPDDVYEKWIADIPNKIVHPSIQRYSIINLNDAHQRDHLLFPLLKFNMYAIDFWLSRDVLPREAKTFTHKLTCTAWDLCSQSLTHKVTGFSGTNDTKDILPMPIAQNDLKELESTNEEMRQKLLRPENQCYCALPANVTGKQIIQKLIQVGIPVLLDAGALMLELNNKQVAIEWLKLAPDMYDVGVYFDDQDILQTIDRNGIMAEFECSSYRKNLGRCLVYLDDAHTRGTDLKFPLGTRACVTLCGDITRDKTVQAAMRMRQLSKGHTIAFWASSEANARIQSTTTGDTITNENVLKFICHNSETFERNNVSHWAASAFNYTKKLIGHKLINDVVDERSLVRLYEHCLESDYATLIELYGDIRKAPLTTIFLRKFETLSSCSIKSVRDFKVNILEGVIDRINVKAPLEKKFLSTLDEEQEKELEKEVEIEVQVEKPKPPMKENPATPQFDKRFNRMIRTIDGDSILKKLKTESIIVPVEQCLAHVQFYQKYINKCGWAKHLFATKDFTSVIESAANNCGEYLRPVWWIARINHSNGKFSLILLSSYECDRMISSFRKSTNAVLYMFHPRTKRLHSNLIRESALRVCGWEHPPTISVGDEVQIGMLGGLMYFADDEEQDAYCSFLGLIPRPRTVELENAFTEGIINPSGFVERKNRQSSDLIGNIVGQCNFDQNSTDLAVKLIEAHHQILLSGSHVASVLLRGIKARMNSSICDDKEN